MMKNILTKIKFFFPLQPVTKYDNSQKMRAKPSIPLGNGITWLKTEVKAGPVYCNIYFIFSSKTQYTKQRLLDWPKR